MNGDGYIDWGIGSGHVNTADWYMNIYFGGPAADSIPDLVWHLPNSWDGISGIGDFNGDGFDDLYYYHGQEDYGQVIYGGSPMDTIPDWTRHSPVAYPQQALPSSHGDLDGDGYSDIVTFTASAGRLFIFWGSASPDTLPSVSLTGIDGLPRVFADDLNNDTHDDLLLAFSGDPAQVEVRWGDRIMHSTPNYVLAFPCTWGEEHMADLGDINHDGYRDFAVTSPSCFNNNWGTASVYLGSRWLGVDPAITIEGRSPPLNLIGIYTAAGLGDINGDGVNDFAIGAFNDNFDGWRGRAVVLSGDTTLRVSADRSRPEIPQHLSVSVFPNPFNAETTIALNLPAYTTRARMTVFNLLGQAVSDEMLPTETSQLVHHYDASSLSTGLYLLRVEAGNYQRTEKLMVLR